LHDPTVRAEENLLAIAEHISANPVRKGLAATPEDWPWNAG
jgi:hypothetical protein